MQSNFSILENRKLSNVGLKIEGEGLLHNPTTRDTCLMHGAMPWRGAREKHTLLLQLLIECFSRPGDVVLDCNASTGLSYQFGLCDDNICVLIGLTCVHLFL